MRGPVEAELSRLGCCVGTGTGPAVSQRRIWRGQVRAIHPYQGRRNVGGHKARAGPHSPHSMQSSFDPHTWDSPEHKPFPCQEKQRSRVCFPIRQAWPPVPVTAVVQNSLGPESSTIKSSRTKCPRILMKTGKLCKQVVNWTEKLRLGWAAQRNLPEGCILHRGIHDSKLLLHIKRPRTKSQCSEFAFRNV